jgi:DNA-binding transcriptional LysR family regulator
MLRVDLVRHLRYFVTVAEELHFGRAAERLHMSQPPLSQRIRALEERAGGRLLQRTSRRVELTPLGRRLLPEAQALLDHADRVSGLLDALAEGELYELRVGLPPELPAPAVGGVLAACRAAHPEAEIDLVQGHPLLLEQELLAGRLSLALLRQPVAPGLRPGAVLRRPLGALLRADSPLAAADEVELFELAGHELVLFPRAQAPEHYDGLLADLRALGFAPASVRAADGPAVAAGLVLAGGAVALTDRPPADGDGLAWRGLAGSPLWLRAALTRAPGTRAEALDETLARLIADADGWELAGVAGRGRPGPRPSSGLLA